MLGDGAGEESEEGHGHYADRELAYAYLKTNNTTAALKHALTELERRPDNIDVCETAAWVYYKRGEFSKAEKLMQHARRTNSQNPTLLARAGLIKIKNGRRNEGIALLKKAQVLNPYLEIGLKNESRKFVALK